jgi:hypothetical protein
MIVYFWVNNKLTNTSVNTHSFMLKTAFFIVIIYYIILMFMSYFPRSLVDFSTKFMLYPDYDKEARFQCCGPIYYLEMATIIMNVINQIVQLNFYFNVIKATILRDKTAKYFKNTK